MRYKGYTGRFSVDLDEDVIRGQVVGIRDLVTFQGATIDEARAEFAHSVDEYLEFCQKLGRLPETPHSAGLAGPLTVTIDGRDAVRVNNQESIRKLVALIDELATAETL